jgi:hypothetical protein
MKSVLIGLLALLALTATSAGAQEHGRHSGGGYNGGGRAGGFEAGGFRGGSGYRGGAGYGPGLGFGGPGFGRGGFSPRGYPSAGPRGRFAAPFAPYGGGPSPYRGFTRGQFLPPAYLGGAVADPRQYHLRRPPNGYGWVTVGPNAYLTQRSTGLILDTAPLY